MATQINSVTRARHTIYSDWLNKTVQRLRHWNFHLLSFWLALMLLCDVSYVTINEKFSWKLLHCNDNASKSSAYQGCEVATQIAGSGSGHLNFFGSSRTILFKQSEKIYWIICITRLSHKLPLWMRNPNFKLQLHHQKCLDSACSHPKLFRDPVSQLCWAHSH